MFVLLRFRIMINCEHCSAIAHDSARMSRTTGNLQKQEVEAETVGVFRRRSDTYCRHVPSRPANLSDTTGRGVESHLPES